MGIRGTLFILFLYIALVWLLVFVFPGGADDNVLIHRGLMLTAIGFGAILLWLLAERILGWWRLRSARQKARPAPATPAARPIHEDDTALAALITEADDRLTRAASGPRRRVREMPLYLLVGPTGAGKTSVLHNAGIDAQLLAGQVLGGGTAVTGTRTANIWLANDCIFLEISGRVFQGDTGRLTEFLKVLRPTDEAKGWRRIWNPAVPAAQLRGVILVNDARSYLATAEQHSKLEQISQTARDRLLAIANTFGANCPVYALFTKIDAIPYFSEFFDRLSEGEAGQPFGTLVTTESPGDQNEDRVWAESQTKGLSRDFNDLFLRVSARRLLTLSHESNPLRKPAIYEFPREFKRIRNSLVQFLVDALRPDPLRLNPALRGFFFTGTRQTAARTPVGLEATRAEVRPDRGSMEATRIFRPELTQVMSESSGEVRGTSGALVEKWIFTNEFFQQVLQKDRPPIATRPLVDSKIQQYRTVTVATAAGLALLLSLTWAVSWWGNRRLVSDVETNVELSGRRTQNLSLESLQALDNLRRLLAERLDQPGEWHLNWGLYTGYELRDGVRTAYFRRLQTLLLEQANARLSDRLGRAGTGQNPDSYDAVYRRLKTHITIAGAGCSVDPPVVGGTLKESVAEIHPELEDTRRELVNRQIDYYVDALKDSSPVRLTSDPEAIRNAQDYLNKSRGPQQIYAALISEVRKDSKVIVVREKMGEYKTVLSAPDEVPFEFAREGRASFERWADSGKFSVKGETCVLGAEDRIKAPIAGFDQMRKAKALYYQDYKESWKRFLNQTNVKPYRDLADAASKLDTLAGSGSPLLAVIKFTGDNTNFPVVKAADQGGIGAALSKAVPVLGDLKKSAEKGAAQVEALGRPDFSAADVDRVFQPVHKTVPPDSVTLVTDLNKAYIESLRHLQSSVDRYSKASTAELATLLAQIREAHGQAIAAANSLSDTFRKDTEGVDSRVADLLLQPIRKVPIPEDLDKTMAHGKEADRAKMCVAIQPVLREYPFNRNGKDASLIEISSVFAPASGVVWKYEQQSLGELLVKNGSRWEQKPDVPKPRVSPDMLEFLNRAQQLTDVFFNGGSQQPKLQYILRPIPGQDVGIRLEIDGITLNSKESSIQKVFTWPARPGAPQGASGFEFGGSITTGFGQHTGLWGVFRLFQYADERNLNAPTVTWSKQHGSGGETQPLTPPAKIEIVQFPGGADLFNPLFFSALKCPGQVIVQ